MDTEWIEEELRHMSMEKLLRATGTVDDERDQWHAYDEPSYDEPSYDGYREFVPGALS